ncbi:hypothetical protein [Nocardia arizonensis]|uniref:hypothetical protein n=1 Tax=Nocardia arizonensis TaxID=1141647 RepID=UPI0012E27AA5|nr:hypothetical protein [Nocardia arizonensis]
MSTRTEASIARTRRMRSSADAALVGVIPSKSKVRPSLLDSDSEAGAGDTLADHAA